MASSTPGMVVRIAANLAELKRNLAEGKNQIETTTGAMQKLATSFSGDRIIQSAHNVVAAIGGIENVSKLTAREQANVNRTVEAALEKYRLLGKDAPQAMHAIAQATAQADRPSGILATTVGRLASGFAIGALVDRGVSALVGFAKASFEAAGQIADLSDKTGLSVQTIQEMQHVSAQTGTTVDAFTNAAFKLGVNLSSGKGSVSDALRQVGLSMSEIRAMAPDAQFDAIATALGRMENPQERNRIGMELFGKTFAEIAPAIAAGYRQMADDATLSGEKQVRALADAGDALDRMGARVGSLMTWAGGNVAILMEQIGTAVKAAFGGDVTVAIEGTAQAVASVAAPLTDYNALLINAYEQVNQLSAADRQQLESASKLGVGIAELSERFGISEAALSLYKASLSEADAEQKKAEASAKALAKAQQEAYENSIVWGDGMAYALGAMTRLTAASQELELRGTKAIREIFEFQPDYGMASFEEALQLRSNALIGFHAKHEKTITSIFEFNGDPGIGLFESSLKEKSKGFMGTLSEIFGGGGADQKTGGGKIAQLLGGIGPMFTAAFTGGGGAAGAVKGFATQAVGSLMGMIPVVGPFISQFAGPIVAGFSKIAGKVKDMFKGLFGGPDKDEINGRKLVNDFENNIIPLLSAQGKIQAGGERWKEIIIAITEQYVAQGRTGEEALADVKRLWDSSRVSAEESAKVIAEIEAKMKSSGAAAEEAVDKVAAALGDLPDVVDVTIRGHYESPGEPWEEGSGYAGGTISKGSWFRDFGNATATVLHGKEAVVTPAQAPAFARAVLGTGTATDPELKRLVRDLPRAIKLAVREAMVMA